MATAQRDSGFALPARLYAGPGDPDQDPGTELGLVSRLRARRRQRKRVVRGREFGGTPVAAIEGGVDWLVTAVAREFDPDLLATTFATAVDGGTSGTKGLREPGSWRAGLDLEQDSRAGALLLRPEETSRHGLLLFRALPVTAQPLDEEGEADLLFSGTRALTWLVAFLAVPDSQGRLVELLPTEDMATP